VKKSSLKAKLKEFLRPNLRNVSLSIIMLFSFLIIDGYGPKFLQLLAYSIISVALVLVFVLPVYIFSCLAFWMIKKIRK
jgi:hypothetical protein